ncbi:diacylglycerol kinase [uncultured Desulfovibrio sp.]|uniref:diacylglycerol kinase n=1 Tax=uncultured Desulfovibrio sp. TaxID=167968 RepID=UPI00262877E9|nr:diacylglycerol kinase [uncultured Desulfovibrio sp.]
MDRRNDLKGRRGLTRLRNAVRYSLEGYAAAWRDEEAFRQIALLAGAGLPLACWLGRDWAESVLLAVPLVLCLLVELLNSAIENTVDRISLERHPLAKKAKDMGSAAQFTAQIFLALVWGSHLLGRL